MTHRRFTVAKVACGAPIGPRTRLASMLDEPTCPECQAWLPFGEIARRRCHEQAQYASRAIDGRHGAPLLGAGLRFKGDPTDYHRILIHRDDADEFVRRWDEAKRDA